MAAIRSTTRTSLPPLPAPSPAARLTPGIAIDATGIGSAIAANKITGIRAATAPDERSARDSRERSGANVLALGSTVVSVDEAQAIVRVWLETPRPRPADVRQFLKIRRLEEKGR